MLSKSQIKLITRLKQKKYRVAEGFFVAEGVKVINELLNSTLELHHLFTTETFKINNNETLITQAELKKISFLTTPNKALAVFKIPEAVKIDTNGLIVALDDVRDPGNLGTIIRLCDWYGITNLVCSIGTVDCYNPKVIQATMGSITRVNISYLNLSYFLKQNNKTPILGAFMDGENVYKTKLPNSGILVMGNEANGVSKTIEEQVTNRIAIPRFGTLQATESLNVATATAILLSEFKRNA
ncbi:RNA methyltransferase [Lacinutrix sp. 5H-3-7-4]|uniref:TrmH family RNA methyltransferase n=1 Tax=Lacinutrix sp. (strain 5H-3-7-4) TaxID=983544 RepID=UPI00020A37CC|nr:RNA methyltransferase [Lacinutrix sp. 5H-3-7-4]AEH00376.1 tRNA/rRNA methyltransferase (SpoU) [Lacinutrix sp. 5H-3-7-4]